MSFRRRKFFLQSDDILLLDPAMPKHPGLEAMRELSSPAKATSVRVILLTAAMEKDRIVEALQLGAAESCSGIRQLEFYCEPYKS